MVAFYSLTIHMTSATPGNTSGSPGQKIGKYCLPYPPQIDEYISLGYGSVSIYDQDKGYLVDVIDRSQYPENDEYPKLFVDIMNRLAMPLIQVAAMNMKPNQMKLRVFDYAKDKMIGGFKINEDGDRLFLTIMVIPMKDFNHIMEVLNGDEDKTTE